MSTKLKYVFYAVFSSLVLGLSGVRALETDIGPIGGNSGALASYIETLYDKYLINIGLVAGVLMIVYAGFIYTTSSGSPEKIGQAKDILVSTLLGLAVLLTAGIIISLINPNQ